MRTNAVYIHRRHIQQSLSTSTTYLRDVSFCKNESVPCDGGRNPTMFRRAAGDGDIVWRCSNSLGEDNGQPIAQGPRLKEAEGPTEAYPVNSTRGILQRIIPFFSAKVTSPLPPATSPPENKVLKSKGNQKTRPPHWSNSSDKENVSPCDPSDPTAVTILRDFRHKALVEQLIRCPLHSASRRLAHRNFGEELNPGGLHELVDNNVIKKEDVGTRVQRSTVKDTVQRKYEKSVSTSNHNNVENGTPSVINQKKKNTVFRRSQREENLSGTAVVSQKQLKCFFQLVEEPAVAKFLKVDVCRRYADKYLLAMVFTYFVRSALKCHQYSRENFFAALYLAHDMEEDEEELKYEIFPWALGQRWRKSYPSLLRLRDDIFWSIDCRAVVSKTCCDQVMEMQPEHWLWKRERPPYHGGALRTYLKHPSDNGRPRGPGKSPLQCQMCFDRECSNSEDSYLLYLSESDTSIDSVCMGDGKTVMHNERDPGFEIILCEQYDTSMACQTQDSTHPDKLDIEVDKLDTNGQPYSKANGCDNCYIEGK